MISYVVSLSSVRTWKEKDPEETKAVATSPYFPSTCFLLHKKSMLSYHGLPMVQVCSEKVNWQNNEWQAELRQVLPVQKTNGK